MVLLHWSAAGGCQPEPVEPTSEPTDSCASANLVTSGASANVIDVEDLLQVMSSFGVDGAVDVSGDGVTDITDLLWVFAEWGHTC